MRKGGAKHLTENLFAFFIPTFSHSNLFSFQPFSHSNLFSFQPLNPGRKMTQSFLQCGRLILFFHLEFSQITKKNNFLVDCLAPPFQRWKKKKLKSKK